MGTNDHPATLGEKRDTQHQEAEKLLRLAEGLQKECEETERRRVLYFFAGSLAVLTLIGFAVAMLLSSPVPATLNTFFVITAGIYAFVIGMFLVLQQTRFRQSLERDRRALYGIVDMLRELEGAIAEANHLSTLERAEFRIRLSRFGIGPGHHF